MDSLRDGCLGLGPKPGTAALAVFGMLARPGTAPRSIEDLNEAVAAGWAGEV